MSRPTPIPAINGVYFWWFIEIPASVPIEGCLTHDGLTLFYVGISPDKKGNLIVEPISKHTTVEMPKALRWDAH